MGISRATGGSTGSQVHVRVVELPIGSYTTNDGAGSRVGLQVPLHRPIHNA